MNKFAGTFKVLSIAGVIIFLYWFNRSYLQLTPADIRVWILSFGWFAPLLYVVLYTFRPLILFPASVLSITGGLAFGTLWGTVLTVIGATAGAALSFFISRYAGKNFVRREWKGRLKTVELRLEKKGLLYVLLLRLVPLFPFDLISYAAGLSKIRFRAFLAGTFFGIIPGTFVYNFLGASFAEGTLEQKMITVAIFLASTAVPLLFRKRLEGDDR